MRGIQMEAWNIHWGGRSWGSSSLIFIPALLSRGEEGILSLFSLDQKCHGIDAWWVLPIYKADLVMRSQWAKDDLWTHEVPTFPHFLYLLLGPILLEKKMATLSSVLALRIPGMGEPGGLLSTGSHGVRHDWSDLAAAAAAGTYIAPKSVASCQSEGSCFPLSACGPLQFIRCLISCHLNPDPISLFIPSYQLAVTPLYMRNTEGNSPAESCLHGGSFHWKNF